jgi:hypothetical protein
MRVLNRGPLDERPIVLIKLVGDFGTKENHHTKRLGEERS